MDILFIIGMCHILLGSYLLGRFLGLLLGITVYLCFIIGSIMVAASYLPDICQTLS